MRLTVTTLAATFSLLAAAPALAWNLPSVDLPADHTRIGGGIAFASFEHAWGDDWITSAGLGFFGYSIGGVVNVTRPLIRTTPLSLGLTLEGGIQFAPSGPLNVNTSAPPISFIQPGIVAAFHPLKPVILRASLGVGEGTGFSNADGQVAPLTLIWPMIAAEVAIVLTPNLELEIGDPQIIGLACTW